MSIFETLSKINVNEHTLKKNNLTYLPWAWAWGTLKGIYPASFYTVCENDKGWNYFTDGRTCWVKCAVTAVDGDDHQTAVEYLPVMDYRNNAIPADKVTSTDVNKAIQRCLTKAIARLGLGLYIYAGEDLPEDPADKQYPVNVPPAVIEQPVQHIPPVVTISSTVPQTVQAEPQPAACNTDAETPPVIAAPAKSHAAIVKEMCSTLSITQEQFALLKKMCGWSGAIPAVKVSELTDEQFDALLEFVSRNVELAEQPG